MWGLKVGSREYNKHLQEEIEYYKNVYKNSILQSVPHIWQRAEDNLTEKIVTKTGYSSAEYILHRVKGRKKIRLYSMGAGAGGVEIETLFPLFSKNGITCDFFFSDINEEVLLKAKRVGAKRGMHIDISVVDINTLSLPENTYDIIYAHASLHHLVNLDHATREINKGLKRNGYFITNDICTRNGYVLWDETEKVINALWAMLPPKYKISHTAFATPTYLDRFPNINLARKSFECIRSQDVVPALRRNLVEKVFVPAHAFMRRFFDTQFGPNFNSGDALDRAIIEYIVQLDNYYINSKILKPETFFGVYKKKNPPRLP